MTPLTTSVMFLFALLAAGGAAAPGADTPARARTNDIAADAPAAANAATTAKPEEAAAPAAGPAEVTPLPRALLVGDGGLFRPGLLLQSWLVYHGDDDATTFRLRRAEIHLRGEVVPGRVAYDVMIDPAKVLESQSKTVAVTTTSGTVGEVTIAQPVSAISALQDLSITYSVPYADISIGQFKIPVSYEGYNSSSRLLFPERAVIARTYGDKRDIGIRVAKRFQYLGYAAGVFNGAGANNLDTNKAKDLGLRLELYPTKGVLIGAVAYGSMGPDGRPANGKERYEGDLRIEHGPWLLQAEYIRGRDAQRGSPAVTSEGFYVAVAWSALDALQAAVRAGYFDPDLGQDLAAGAVRGDELWHFDATVNYYVLANQAKLQLGYSRFQYDDRTGVDEVIFAAQAAY